MDASNTLILILSLVIFILIAWWALTHKPKPRRQLSLEAQRAYEERKGQILADEDYERAQKQKQIFEKRKRELSKRLNQRGGLF